MEVDELATYVDSPAVAAELRRYGSRCGWTPRVPPLRWRGTDGYTGATLATLVLEGETARKVVLKVVPAPRDAYVANPHAYRRASDECPASFRCHLVLLAEAPHVMADGRTLLLQHVAGGDITGCRSLAQLRGQDLVRASRLVATGLLVSWNERKLEPVDDAVGDFLRRTTGSGLSFSGSVSSWAAAAHLLPDEMPWLTVADVVVPNPLGLARHDCPLDPQPIKVFRGRGHGDLHLLNVLVPQSGPDPEPDGFQLIDLDGYQNDRPLTEDPVVLMLSGIAERLVDLPAHQREQVLKALVDPAEAKGPAADLITAVRDTTAAIVRDLDTDWLQEWRLQFQLTALAVALRFTSFVDLGPDRRWWFFRLAALLGRALMDRWQVPVPKSGRVVANPFPRWRPYRPEADVHDAPEPPRPGPIDRYLAHAWTDEKDPVHWLRQAQATVVDVGARAGGAAAARDLQQRLWYDAAQILGRRHVVTLQLRHNLGVWTAEAKDHDTAIAIFEEVALARTEHPELGPWHPDTIASEEASMAWSLRFDATR